MVIPINRELVIQIHLLLHDEAKGSSSLQHANASYLTCYLYSADLLIGSGKGIEERGRIEDAGGHTDAQPSMARGDLAEECFHLA